MTDRKQSFLWWGNATPSILSEAGRNETEKPCKRVQVKVAIVIITLAFS